MVGIFIRTVRDRARVRVSIVDFYCMRQFLFCRTFFIYIAALRAHKIARIALLVTGGGFHTDGYSLDAFSVRLYGVESLVAEGNISADRAAKRVVPLLGACCGMRFGDLIVVVAAYGTVERDRFHSECRNRYS